MPYFLRISSQLRPANNLQKDLLKYIQEFNGLLLDDAQNLLTTIETRVNRINQTHRRCTKEKVIPNRDYQDPKKYTAISIGSLVTLTLHNVSGMYLNFQFTPPPKLARPAPEPVGPPPPPPESYPRQPVYAGREDNRILTYVRTDKIGFLLRRQIEKGEVWRVYRNVTGLYVAELFGGKIQPCGDMLPN